MLIVLSGIATGFVVGLARGGRFGNLGRLELRFGWGFVVAWLVQFAVMARLAHDPRVPLSVAGGLLIGSYLAVLGIIVSNRKLPGIWIVGVGLMLNLLATLPHGGFMPVTAELLEIAGYPVPSEVLADGARPYIFSKDVVLPLDRIPLWPISDRFVIPRGWPLAGVFSPGDVVVAIGMAWLLQRGLSDRRDLRFTRPLAQI